MPESTTNHLLGEIGTRQHGLVGRHQLLDAGLSEQQIERLLGNGRLTRIDEGAYLVTGAAMSWHARLLGVCLGTGGIASHRSAAVLHGIEGFRQGPPEISVPRQRNARHRQARIHWSTDLDRVIPTMIDHIPVTPLDRTLLDLAAVCAATKVEAAIDWAVSRRRTTWPDLADTYTQHSRPGRRGCGPIRRILEVRLDDGHVIESVLERDLMTALDNAGLTGYETQVEIVEDGRFIMRADFGWPWAKLALEADSLAFHLNRRSFLGDKDKRTQARSFGWQILEYTAEEIRKNPHRIVAEARRCLDNARSQGLTPPSARSCGDHPPDSGGDHHKT